MELEEIKQKVDAFRETVPREIKDMYFSHKNVDFNGFYNMDYYFLGALEATKKSQKKNEQAKEIIKKFFKHVPRLDLITCMGEHNVIEAEKFIAE